MRICQEHDRDPRLATTTSAVVVLILLAPFGQVADRSNTPNLVVNEFFFRGSPSDLEFVEIHNRSANPVDLTSIQLSDSRRRPVALTGTPRILPGGGYAVAVRDAATFDTRFDFSDRIEPSTWPALNNGGDTVILWKDGIPIDSVEYTSSWGGDDVSLERLDPAGPSSVRANWAESVDRSGGTPGRLNSVFAPDNQPPRPVFCEETAPGSLAVYFTEPIAPGSIVPEAFRFDSGSTPHDAVVDESGDAVHLVIGTALTAESVSMNGISDLSGNTLAVGTIPIAWLPRPGQLVLNEIMFEPLADEYDSLPDQPEYIEIVSTTNRLISTRTLFLTDRLREDGTRDTTSLGGRRQAFAPGRILLVHARTDPGQDPLAAFPATDRSNPDLVVIQLEQSTLSLGNNGDLVRLEGALGLVDAVEYEPAWHLPERVATRGWSLERISVSVDSQDPANWSTSVDPSGGTPGRPNSIRFDDHLQPEFGNVIVSPSPFSPDGDGFEDFAKITVEIPNATAVLRIWIYDLNGVKVREVERATPVGPSSSTIWDGRDERGESVERGLYVILVEAVDVGTGYVERLKTLIPLVR